MTRTFLTVLMFACSVPICTRAAPVMPWKYEKLFSESDLVVIARPKGTKKLLNSDMPGFIPDDYSQALVPALTELEVVNSVKGDGPKSITLEHWAHQTHPSVSFGPDLFSFRAQVVNVSGDGFAAQLRYEYLLFLKKASGDRYRLAAGSKHMFLSVRMMHEPF